MLTIAFQLRSPDDEETAGFAEPLCNPAHRTATFSTDPCPGIRCLERTRNLSRGEILQRKKKKKRRERERRSFTSFSRCYRFFLTTFARFYVRSGTFRPTVAVFLTICTQSVSTIAKYLGGKSPAEVLHDYT